MAQGHVAGQNMKFNARSQLPLPVGTPVFVIDVLSATAVEVVSTAPQGTTLVIEANPVPAERPVE